MRFSDITEDGTYMLDAHGDLHRMNYTSGYTVAKLALWSDKPSNPFTLEMPKLALLGKWTHPVSGVIYWDEVEVIDSLLEAGNVARQRGELAIWDNLNNREVFV